MKIGVTLAKFDMPAEKTAQVLKQIAETLEEHQFSSVWVMDHFFQLEPMLGMAEEPMHEAYTTLGFLAGVTKKISLGALVTGVIYRNPGLLIKAMTTLDVLSEGRSYFGIGAGWYEREAVGLGFGFPTTQERFEMFEEILLLAHQMWRGDSSAFVEKHFELAEPICSPLPIQKPYPKILIGGEGEKKTLRYVAKYGDACNLFAQPGVEHVKQKLKVLQAHCEDEERDYNEIEKTVLDFYTGDATQTLRKITQLQKLGIDQVIFGVPGVEKITPLEVIGSDVVRHL